MTKFEVHNNLWLASHAVASVLLAKQTKIKTNYSYNYRCHIWSPSCLGIELQVIITWYLSVIKMRKKLMYVAMTHFLAFYIIIFNNVITSIGQLMLLALWTIAYFMIDNTCDYMAVR